MSIGYTGLSKGNLELATIIVALSFLLAIVAVPVWMTVFAAQYQVQVPMQDMVFSILSVLVAPMILGYVTRITLVRWLGERHFQRLQPLFPSIWSLAIFASFS